MLKDNNDKPGSSLPISKHKDLELAVNSEEVDATTADTNSNTDIPTGCDNNLLTGRLKKIALITGTVLAVVLITAVIYLIIFYNQIQETQQVILEEVIDNQENHETNIAIAQEDPDLNEVYSVFPEHIVNIALLGFDRGWDREGRGHYMFRPDVLALISIDFEQDQISVVRILRDSYVPIHDAEGFHDKMNHAYHYGYYAGDGEDQHADGVRYTLLTMSDVLGGVPIHYYLSVDMYSVIALVDALGGIYYDVEEEIVDEVWIFGVLLPPIEPGPQVLDGTNYMRYLQYRDSRSGQEYGRIERQGQLLRETYHYLRENGRITDIPVIFNIYRDYVDTDLSYKKIAALANYALKMDFTDENLHFYTIEGSGQMKDGIYYEIISQEQRLEIIDKVFGVTVEPWPPIVLEDSPEYLQEQERERRLQEREGFSPQIPIFDEMNPLEGMRLFEE